METFKRLKLRRWRQFENVDIDFSSNLSVLTGKNGCGKSTILNILGRHFGWNIHLISTPYLSKKKKENFGLMFGKQLKKILKFQQAQKKLENSFIATM
ncbi:MAG: AAA family ATPase [Chitinophagaceae bacterium]|nr:AAA family ATPase [Chitinophagaceae bacterium]